MELRCSHGYMGVTTCPMRTTVSVLEEEEELVQLEELLQLRLLRRITPGQFGRLRRRGLIPFVELGHKTYLYSPAKVLAAFRKMERPAKGTE
jgi:hypothetical protein